MDIEKIIELKDSLLNRIEESLKMIDNINYCEDDFLDYRGAVYSKVNELRDDLTDDICSIVSCTNKYDLALAMYLRGESYWRADEMLLDCKNADITILDEAYDLYKECFFERPKLNRFENIEDVKEYVFELYKINRRCDTYKSQEYSILLANICEFINVYDENVF